MSLQSRAELLQWRQLGFWWLWPTDLSGLAVELGKDGGEGDLRNDLFLIGILEEWCGGQIQREKEERWWYDLDV